MINLSEKCQELEREKNHAQSLLAARDKRIAGLEGALREIAEPSGLPPAHDAQRNRGIAIRALAAGAEGEVSHG